MGNFHFFEPTEPMINNKDNDEDEDEMLPDIIYVSKKKRKVII